jgi:hypothetical protein
MATYKLIETVTVGSGGSATITFASIPATYTDLILKLSVRNTSTSGSNNLAKLNLITSGYTDKYLQGNGASVSSGSNLSTTRMVAGENNTSSTTANTFTSVDIYIPNYAGSNNKISSIESAFENNATTAYTTMQVSLSSNSAAITDIELTPSANSFAEFSSASLYGIKNQ